MVGPMKNGIAIDKNQALLRHLEAIVTPRGVKLNVPPLWVNFFKSRNSIFMF